MALSVFAEDIGFSLLWGSSLDDWFNVKVVVRGQAVLLYINEKLEFEYGSFLKIPTGKVGFRNVGSERALVRNVSVTTQQ